MFRADRLFKNAVGKEGDGVAFDGEGTPLAAIARI